MHKQAKWLIMTPPGAAAHSSFAGPFVLPVRHMSAITLTEQHHDHQTRYLMQNSSTVGERPYVTHMYVAQPAAP